MKRLVIVASIAVLTLPALGTAPANACTCLPPPPPDQALDEADAVFTGEAVEVRLIKEWYDLDGERPRGGAWWIYSDERVAYRTVMYTRFDVLDVWKGVDEYTVWVRTVPNEAMCGYAFRVGERYLIYAYATDEVGVLTTGLCTRTVMVRRGEDPEDLEALPEPSTELQRAHRRDIAEEVKSGVPVIDGELPKAENQ